MAAAGETESGPVIEHPLVPSGSPILVEDDAGLAEALDACRAAGTVAYDTEFIGEETYVPRFCLVQLATTETVWLVDPLAGVDLGPVWEFVGDPEVTTIVHAGSQDLEPVVRLTGKPPENVIDTQIAAGFLDLPYPLSLAGVIEHMLGVRLGKGMTFTRWDKRPLSRSHLRYGADDVRYLPAAWTGLAERLAACGHEADVREECDAVLAPERFGFDVDRRAERIIGTRNMRPRQVAMTRSLLELRDAVARKRDVPPRALLKDDVVLRIAKEMPVDRGALERVKGLPWPFIESHGDTLNTMVADLKAKDPSELPPRVSEEESVADRVAIDTLWSFVQVLCRAEGIDPSLAAGRKEIARFWAARRGRGLHRRHGLESGWRERLVGSRLTALLDGETVAGFRWADGSLRPAAS